MDIVGVMPLVLLEQILFQRNGNLHTSNSNDGYDKGGIGQGTLLLLTVTKTLHTQYQRRI